MAKAVIVTGDKEVTRALNALGSTRARAIHGKAMRLAAKVVLAHAQATVPVRSGAYRRSLTVRALPRSRKYQGARVTQRPIRYRGGKRAKVFYGAFLELGWKSGGTRRRISAEWRDGTRKIKIERKQVKSRKVVGRWLMRKAGTDKESEARGIYLAEVKRLIDTEWVKGRK